MGFTPPKPARLIACRLPKGASKWTQHKIQNWCRQQLGGAPPSQPKETSSGITLKWAEVKDYAGRQLDLKTDFKGLIVNDIFEMADYIPPMSMSGTRRTTSDDSILSNISDIARLEDLIGRSGKYWGAVDNLVSWYNISEMKEYDRQGEAMFRAGREMKKIMDIGNEHFIVNEDNLRYSIAAWGVGHEKNGYGEQQLEYCLKLYKWIGDVDDHAIFEHRTTPLLKFIMNESKDLNRRTNLFEAFHRGPLEGITDGQLNWVLAKNDSKAKGSFNLGEEYWNEMFQLKEKLASTGNLNEVDGKRLREILDLALSTPSSSDEEE